MMRKYSTRLRSLFTRDRMEQDLDRELAFHLDMLTEQDVQAGMSPNDARRVKRSASVAAGPAASRGSGRLHADLRVPIPFASQDGLPPGS